MHTHLRIVYCVAFVEAEVNDVHLLQHNVLPVEEVSCMLLLLNAVQVCIPAPFGRYKPAQDMTVTPSDLTCLLQDFEEGNGSLPQDGQQVTFDYTAYNESGARIDSTYQKGRPAQTRLGINGLIPGQLLYNALQKHKAANCL